MRRLPLVGIFLLLSACAQVIPVNYSKADAGAVLLSIYQDAPGNFDDCILYFRRAGVDKTKASAAGHFFYDWSLNGLFSTGKNYADGAERGMTVVASLAPGEYELFNYNFHKSLAGGMFTVEKTYFPKETFSIRFTVLPGGLVYLGSYQAIKSPAGARLSISNRLSKDLSVAKGFSPVVVSRSLVDMTPERSYP